MKILEIELNLSSIDHSLVYEEDGDMMVRTVCFVYDKPNRHGTVGMQVQWIPVEERIKGDRGPFLGYIHPTGENEEDEEWQE